MQSFGPPQLSHTDGEKPFDVHFRGLGVSGVTTVRPLSVSRLRFYGGLKTQDR